MISRKEIQKIVDEYNLQDVKIGVIASHSALDARRRPGGEW